MVRIRGLVVGIIGVVAIGCGPTGPDITIPGPDDCNRRAAPQGCVDVPPQQSIADRGDTDGTLDFREYWGGG